MSSMLDRARLGAGLTVLALSLAACGGGQSTPGQAATSTTAAGAASSTTAPATTSTTAGSSLFGDDAPTPAAGLFGGSAATLAGTGASSGSQASAPGSANGPGTGTSASSTGDGGVDPAEVKQLFGSDNIDVALALALAGACDGGDMQACDTLYYDSVPDSRAEAFGSTCGNRTDHEATPCVEALSSPSTGSYVPTGQPYPAARPTDSTIAGLLLTCERGSMTSCDALLFVSQEGAAPYAYGELCGGRSTSDDLCVDQFGLGRGVLDEFLAAAGIGR